MYSTLALISALSIFVSGAVPSMGTPAVDAEIKDLLPATQAVFDEHRSYMVWATAYSSEPNQTDSTPFITASNTRVRDGVVAANFLPFGTKVQIPALFGDKIFTVEDRLHGRFTDTVDVWMTSRHHALKFGRMRTEILVVEDTVK